ncbi:universal stress protein [SAR202 cluster bacterium AC-409-J13_OGT_754m]|nr:universal stress protein [SAR202 cluster bacterium AC-409-J13_OGT_754m]
MDIGKLISAKNILLPVNGGPGQTQAFNLACSLAKQSKGKIHAFYVIEVSRKLPLDAEVPSETEKGESALSVIETMSKNQKCPLEAELVQARHAGPTIVRQAKNRNIDLIVLSLGHNSTSADFHLGKTTSHIMQNAHCPVLLWKTTNLESIPS